MRFAVEKNQRNLIESVGFLFTFAVLKGLLGACGVFCMLGYLSIQVWFWKANQSKSETWSSKGAWISPTFNFIVRLIRSTRSSNTGFPHGFTIACVNQEDQAQKEEKQNKKNIY